jgi:hypothetical protein
LRLPEAGDWTVARYQRRALQPLVGWRLEEYLSHLALPPSSGDALRAHEVHVSAFQYPKPADVFLGLKVRSVGDEDSAIGLRSQGLCGPKAQPNFLTPAAIISLLSAWISRPIASST